MLNIISTTNIAKLNVKKIILGSTCKAANPITSYGASKLICERIVLNKGGNELDLLMYLIQVLL